MDSKKIGKIIKSTLIWFVIFWVGMLLIQEFFPVAESTTTDIAVAPVRKTMVMGGYPIFDVSNNLKNSITFNAPCEDLESSLKVFATIGEQKMEVFPTKNNIADCEKFPIHGFELLAGESTKFDLRQFSNEVFTQSGNYFIEMTFAVADGTTQVVKSDNIEVSEAGVFRQLFRSVISSLLFNCLVFFTDVLPGHYFGLSIILLTLLVRLLLFIPNQKAMRSQRELQKLQPKLEELKSQYGKNQQVLAVKTMELYKSHKINPMSACLPILFQMPFLIGIYGVVKDGLSPHLSYLLWQPLINFDFSSANLDFLLWRMDQPEKIYLPIMVGLAQFLAIKLSIISVKKKKQEQPSSVQSDQMAQMQKMMLYVMPVMIGFFTASFPAGVGIYWVTSTVFGIFQQQLVNWQLDKPQIRRKE